jgi:hypothetical protein
VSGLWHSNLPISAVVIDSDDSDNEIKTTEPIIKTRRLCRMQEIAYQELLWKDKAKEDMYQYVLSLNVSRPPFGLCICHPKKPMNLEADSQQPVTDYDNYLILVTSYDIIDEMLWLDMLTGQKNSTDSDSTYDLSDDIEEERLDYMKSINAVQGSCHTIRRYNVYNGVVSLYADGEILNEFPIKIEFAGEMAIDLGLFEGSKILIPLIDTISCFGCRSVVSRDRVRQVLRSIDPLAAATRWPPSIIRRKPYSVPGPNSLWHIDSHHKLIRWRFVSHGCIDGYSRLIVYLHCSSNNRSTTVYDLFLKAVFTYSLPSRVRSDHGMENILVARHKIEKRGADRCSMITGSSTHNQRIERLWRDMHQSCTILYYKLFYFMEEIGILNPLNEYHLWALHYVYLARINRSLTQFISSWNNHCIRTANHKTPYQLYTSGILLLQNSNIDALDFYDNKDDTYGIDSDGPIPVSDNLVEVPQTTLGFSEDDIMYLKQTVNPCTPSDEYEF